MDDVLQTGKEMCAHAPEEILKQIRISRGMTQLGMAKLLGVSAGTIQSVEHGKLSLYTLRLYRQRFSEEMKGRFSLICRGCGANFISETGILLFCPECRRKHPERDIGKSIFREKYKGNFRKNKNPVTDLTVHIVCMYHIEGQSERFIASELMRPVRVIRRILNEAKKDGTYERFLAVRQNGYDSFRSNYFEFYRILTKRRLW